jgi:Flp pilus assembly protein TadG
MVTSNHRRKLCARRGVASAELAILAPFLAFIFLVTLDWARIFYFTVVLENASRNGAYYASDYGIYDYQNPPDAALEDTSNLSPAPTISYAYSTSPTGPFSLTSPPPGYIDGSTNAWAQVTSTWTFNTITGGFFTDIFQIPSSVTLTRTVEMQMAPIVPKFN